MEDEKEKNSFMTLDK